MLMCICSQVVWLPCFVFSEPFNIDEIELKYCLVKLGFDFVGALDNVSTASNSNV